MSSIAAIDRRCFVSPPPTQGQPAPRAPQEDRTPWCWSAACAVTWRPPQAREDAGAGRSQ